MYAHVRDTVLYFDIDGMGLTPQGGQMVERPPLFLLHGGPGGDHSGFKSTHPLRDLAQLIFLDHRGCGRSDEGDAATYTLDNNIEDLEALRAHLGLDRICLLGSSYGGMVAQGYAIRYPHRVSNLILVCTAPSFRFIHDARTFITEHGTPDQQRVCGWLWEGAFSSMEQLHEYYRTMGPLYSRNWDAVEFEAVWHRTRRSFVALNRGFGDFLRTFDFTEQLSQIPCPTLVIAGAHDWICAPHHSQLIARLIPRAQLKIFARSGHSVSSDENELYLQAIRGFLTYAPG